MLSCNVIKFSLLLLLLFTFKQNVLLELTSEKKEKKKGKLSEKLLSYVTKEVMSAIIITIDVFKGGSSDLE